MEPAGAAKATIDWVHRILKEERDIDDPKKRAVGFKLSEAMEVPAELAARFKFARQKSKLAGTIRHPANRKHHAGQQKPGPPAGADGRAVSSLSALVARS